MPGEIKTEMRGGALIIKFSRPKCGNALTMIMASQLLHVLKTMANEPAVRAIMLCGEGGHFMDGIDIDIYKKDISAGVQHKTEVLLPYHSAIRELHMMNKPVMSVVSGRAARAGLSFVLVSDLVLAGRSARFTAGYTKLAMAPDGGVSYLLTRKVGLAKATEILMLNDELDADEAHRLNLVNAVHDDAVLQEKAYEWIDRLANGPTKALGAVKRLVDQAYLHGLFDHIGLEHTYWGVCSHTFDFHEAVRGYFAGKPVTFKGA